MYLFFTIFLLKEFLKCTVDLADLVGIHLVMSKIAGKGQLKFMVAGLGWATAELLMTRWITDWKLRHLTKNYVDVHVQYVVLQKGNRLAIVKHDLLQYWID